MVETWRNLGFEVDVIDYRNAGFKPSGRYDFFVSARKHLAEVAPRLNPDCVKIAHLDVTHFATQNAAGYRRLQRFQERHGLSVPESIRLIEPNYGIEAADVGVMLGNSVTRASYDYASKVIHLQNVPAVADYSDPGAKNFESARRRFLYLGSGGLLTKGVDLAIEAFMGMKDLELTVCGPTRDESRLLDVYAARVQECGNITMCGWIDVASAEFRDLANRCVGLVYPSCAEGQAGAVVTCVKAGLLPVITPQSGLDVSEYGATIHEPTVGGVQEAVRGVSEAPPDVLRDRAHLAWSVGNRDHSRRGYLDKYRETVSKLLACSSVPSAG